MSSERRYSLIVPVYKNEGSLFPLMAALGRLDEALDHQLEVVFVVDGRPDACFPKLDSMLPG